MISFKEIAQQDIERSKEIEQQLVEFVKQHGNFIDMRNIDERNDRCYGIIYNEGSEHYEEMRIVALTTFNDDVLGVLTEGEFETFEDCTREEMEGSENWVTIFGGIMWVNATLISICEVVEEYV